MDDLFWWIAIYCYFLAILCTDIIASMSYNTDKSNRKSINLRREEDGKITKNETK